MHHGLCCVDIQWSNAAHGKVLNAEFFHLWLRRLFMSLSGFFHFVEVTGDSMGTYHMETNPLPH